MAIWAIKSELDMGFGKILRKTYPTDQIESLQILSNGGIPTKLIIRDLDNDVLCRLQILWGRHITQQELRYVIRIILGKLEINTDIEMAVISIHREKENAYNLINEAVDIVEASELTLKDKIAKWQVIQNWNNKPDTNQWLKYDQIDPKCQILSANWKPYNVIKEFDLNNNLVKTIELTIWSQKDVDKHIGDIAFDRSNIDLKIYQGNYLKNNSTSDKCKSYRKNIYKKFTTFKQLLKIGK